MVPSEGVLYFRGKAYVPDAFDLRRRIVTLCHDSKVAGHPVLHFLRFANRMLYHMIHLFLG